MKSSKKITTPKTKSLKDLIDSTEWMGLQTRGSSSKLPSDAVSVHFTLKSAKSKKDNVNSDYVRMRFGADILQKLNWTSGDRIFISTHPDDHFTFLLCKVESNNGFKLSFETNSTVARLHFAWRPDYIPVKAGNAHLVEYEIHKKQLIFRVNLPA